MLEIIILSLLALFGLLKYLGVFQKIEFNDSEIGPLKILYVQNLGQYTKSGYKIQQVVSQLSKHRFNVTKTFGIYYDLFDNKKQKKLQRSVVGIILQDPVEKVQKFLKFDQNFQFCELPKVKAIGCTPFPYQNFFSLNIMLWKIYSPLKKYMKKFHEADYGDTQACMELYTYQNTYIYVPLGSLQKQYFLTLVNEKGQLIQGKPKQE